MSHASRALLLGIALASFGCGLGRQALTSPCVGQPTDGGSCPSCTADADCAVVGNHCHTSSACVPSAGNWATTMEGCAFSYDPPLEACVCFEKVCQRQPTR